MIIKGKKLILRPIRLSDASRFVKWVNDPEVNKLLRGNTKKITLKEERKWIKSLPKKVKTEKQFAIEASNGIHIGSLSLILDIKNKCAVFGILIGDKNYWNRGYGTEATNMILAYGFNNLKLHRIELNVFIYNKRAIKVYKNLGFKFEGVKRESLFYKDKFFDVVQMGVLNKERIRKN